MKKYIFFLLLITVGCYKKSEIKYEYADVIQLAYVPSTSGSGVGITGKGDLSVNYVDTDEVWAVVVNCKNHNKTFSIRGKENYFMCKVGKKVKLAYVEYTNSKGEVVDYKTIKIVNGE